MIFFRHISDVKAEDVLRLREVEGEIIYSIRYPNGSITSIRFSEILGVLRAVSEYQGHVTRAKEELEHFYDYEEEDRLRIYGYRELTDERKLKLHETIFTYEDLVISYNRCWGFFDQLAEAHRAGLANSGVEYLAYLEGRRNHIADQRPAITRFRQRCEELGLGRNKTIPRKTLFHIMTAIGLYNGTYDEFTTESKAYVTGREYASRLGYSQKGSSRYQK